MHGHCHAAIRYVDSSHEVKMLLTRLGKYILGNQLRRSDITLKLLPLILDGRLEI